MKAKFFALMLGWVGLAAAAYGQGADTKMGSDPNECLKNYSLYFEFYKQENYAEALPWWKKTIAICPAFSKNLWIHGEKMYQSFIDTETNPVHRETLIDTLMWVYDERIKYFGNDPRNPEGYVLGLKGITILRYRKEDYSHAYDYLGESIKQMKMISQAAIVTTYMQCSRQLFLDGVIDAEKVLTDYETSMEIIDLNLRETPGDPGFTMAAETVEQFFSTSGAASCEALINLYSPKFAALKDDVEWLRKITRQLRRADCTDSRIFSDASEQLFRLEPDADAAHNLAAFFMRQADYEKAAQYLKQSIAIGEGSKELADMYYELAYLKYFHYKDYQESRNLALKAIEARENWGKPYILIGRLYIDARNQISSDEFEQSTVFWAAVDKFIKAKSVDPEVNDEANQLINSYSQYFPNNEVIFFRTMRDGDTYRVGGWINETTKVRARKN